MAGHAWFSPSAAERLMVCAGSMVLHAAASEPPSVYADEGTLAHWLAAHALYANLGYVRDYLTDNPEGKHTCEGGAAELRIDEDMCDYVQMYVDYVRREADGAELEIERRLHFNEMVGLSPHEGFGTADAIVLRDDSFTLIDLKYGRGVPVAVERNKQLMIYALGVLQEYGHLNDFKVIKLVICQPRLDHIDEWTVTAPELLAFAEEMESALDRIDAAVAVAQAGGDLTKYLTPGEDQCRWCNAKATCPALAAEVARVTLADFGDLTQLALPVPQPPSPIGAYMSKVGLVEQWCLAVRAETERRLLEGDSVDGWKLVQGRRGARAWSDAEQAEALMKTKFRLKVEEMYDFKLVSPTKAEKVLFKSPKRWAQLATLVAQSDGKPSVAPESDKRPTITVAASVEEFDVIAPVVMMDDLFG